MLKSSLKVIHNNVWSCLLLFKVSNQAVCESRFSYFVGSKGSSLHLLKSLAILNVQSSCCWRAPWVKFTLFVLISVKKWWYLTVWLPFLLSFGKIHWPCIDVFWVNYFLYFMQIWVIIEEGRGNVFSGDTFTGSHLIGKARHIYILDYIAYFQKCTYYKNKKKLKFPILAGLYIPFFEPYVYF